MTHQVVAGAAAAINLGVNGPLMIVAGLIGWSMKRAAFKRSMRRRRAQGELATAVAEQGKSDRPLWVAALSDEKAKSVRAVLVDVNEPRLAILCQRSATAVWEPLWGIKGRTSMRMELPSCFCLCGESIAALDETLGLLSQPRSAATTDAPRHLAA